MADAPNKQIQMCIIVDMVRFPRDVESLSRGKAVYLWHINSKRKTKEKLEGEQLVIAAII